MTQKLVISPSLTTVDNIVTFDTTTGQIKDSGTAISSINYGDVLQVLQTVKTDTFTISASSWNPLTGMSQAITLTTANNYVLILVCLNASSFASEVYFRLMRDAVPIHIGDTYLSALRVTKGSIQSPTGVDVIPMSITYLDQVNSVSPITYSIEVYAYNTSYVNRSYTDTNSIGWCRCASSITLMELSQ